jgi:hypothetical protein
MSILLQYMHCKLFLLMKKQHDRRTPLPGAAWKNKHAFARLFYSTFSEPMMHLWVKVSAGRELRPSVWTEFVESPELWKMVWDRFITMSHITVDNCAHSELSEDGMDVLTQERETYFLVPLSHVAYKSGNPLSDTETQRVSHYACQQLLKTMLMYFFADVYGKEFTVKFTSHENMTVNRQTIMQPLFPELR